MKLSRTLLVIACVVLVTGLACLIAGIVMITRMQDCEDNIQGTKKQNRGQTCGYSQEAVRVELEAFLQKVQDAYFEFYPYRIATKPGVKKPQEIRAKFQSYDPSPANLKRITDAANELLKEVSEKKITEFKLKPRERKALAQVKHFLKHIFATPFDGNYYSGDYLLGPNSFCYQPICEVGRSLGQSLVFFKPSTLDDVQILKEKLAAVNETFSRYVENLRYGVLAGMVRSVEQCRAGLDAVKGMYSQIAQKGEQGVLEERYMKDILDPQFLSNITADQLNEWKDKHNKTVNQSIQEYAVEYVGKPIHNFLRFLETEQMKHCVPSIVSSGLATLPLSYVYVNGNADVNKTTSRRLPTGEPLNGTRAYLDMLSFFTTTENTPDEVHKLGYEMLDKLYPEAVAVARNETGISNSTKAINKFKEMLNSSDQYFNEGEIPANESNANAHLNCSSVEDAKTHCPKRMEAMERWFSQTREVMSKLSPKTVDMFYFTGAKQTTPNCPLELVINFNPSMGVPSYRGSDKDCNYNAHYYMPFFLERPGPRYMQWSTSAHEGRPGHHTQIQGLTEHFQDACGGLIGWLSSTTFYTAFGEGWALYAENPLIAKDTDVYNEEPLYKYGMLKSQVWRAIRLIVDTGLHAKGFSRHRASQFFAEKMWDDGDVMQKEVTRYQSVPGQATSYMIGQLHIMKLREKAEKELGKAFNLKEFHFQLLYQGSAPLSYLEESITQYVECVKDKEKQGCDEVLNPLAGASNSEFEPVSSMFYF